MAFQDDPANDEKVRFMNNLLFYITGHGYGHFVRTFDVIKHLLTARPDIVCHVKTTTPVWLTRHQDIERVHFYHEAMDVGAIQENSFSVKIKATLEAYADLVARKPILITNEIRFIRENEIRLVVGDIPPFAFDAAHQSGVPGIAIGNFSWDWIYQPYADEFPQHRFLIDEIRQSYSRADLLLRLPAAGDMSAFRRIEDIPLIARRSVRQKQDVLAKLELGADFAQKIILLALRNHDLTRMDTNLWKTYERYLFVIPDTAFSLDKNILTIPADFCLFEDLIMASDLVVSKPGYGIVSGCIANRTPLLYTSRDDFAEYDMLHYYIQQNMPAIFVPREDFIYGKWVEAISFKRLNEQSWSEVAIDGTEKAAARICSILDNVGS
ncbi:MAG: hypothetical protein ACOY90_14510 [Candidatus Zhuqueibacterota bacterium]